MMSRNRVLLIINLCCLSLMFTLSSYAQDDPVLEFFTPQSGTITPSQATQGWSFDALANEVVSVHVRATSTDFDPLVQIVDIDGRVIISNDDYDYPNTRDALLEAITLPRTGTYQAVVSGFDGSTGDYEIILTAGYADVITNDGFDDSTWQTIGDASAEQLNSTLIMRSEGVEVGGITQDMSSANLDNFYAQVDVMDITGRSGWRVGLTLRTQANVHYLLTISSRGTWQFYAVEDGERRVIRDSTQHPAIVPAESDFTLGVLANGAGFDVFYNGQIVGQVVDEAISNAGRIGLFLETASAVGATASATFDNFYVTTPTLVDNVPVFPERIVLGTTEQIAHELERRGVIPTGGELRFEVPQSFVDSTRPGVIFQPLASDSTFTSFMMGTTVNIVQNARPDLAGCGLVFRYVSETSYMIAYMDTVGGYGISPRAGNQFQPGLFNENPELFTDEDNSLLLVVLSDMLYFYVNGQFVGMLDIPAQEGGVGNALLNYESVSTTCQFSDTWLWSLD